MVVQAKVFGQNVFNVLHFKKLSSSAWTVAELYELAQKVGDAWVGAMLPQLSVSYILGNIVATDISVAGGFQGVYTATAGQTGAIATAALPNNVAFCLKFLSGHVGRSYRGRIYIGGIPGSVVVANAVNGTWATNTAAALVTVNTDTAAVDYTQVIVSRYADGVLLTPPETRVVETITWTDLNTDSQRKRLNGRGA